MKNLILFILVLISFNAVAQKDLNLVDGQFKFKKIYQAKDFPDELTLPDIKINNQSPSVSSGELVAKPCDYSKYGYKDNQVMTLFHINANMKGNVVIERKDDRVRVTITNIIIEDPVMRENNTLEFWLVKNNGELRNGDWVINSLDVIEKELENKLVKTSDDW
jgi:hypothetical protein